MVLVKEPMPEPSVVLVANAIVGLAEVLQTTPRCVIVAPPSETIVPPLVTVVAVILATAVVVRFPTSSLRQRTKKPLFGT